MKHPIYTEKSSISFEKYEPNDDTDCSINRFIRSIDDGICCTRTTCIGTVWRLWRRLWHRLGGCGGGVFVHKTIIQTINQVNNCTGNAHGALPMDGDHVNQDHNQKDKQTICLNTAVKSAERGVGNNVPGLG